MAHYRVTDICPLFVIAGHSEPHCFRERCIWWDGKGDCRIPSKGKAKAQGKARWGQAGLVGIWALAAVFTGTLAVSWGLVGDWRQGLGPALMAIGSLWAMANEVMDARERGRAGPEEGYGSNG